MLGALVFSLLPLLAALFGAREPGVDWREAFVRSTLAWGAGVLLATEALSAFEALRFFPVLALWLIAHAAVIFQIWRAPRRPIVWGGGAPAAAYEQNATGAARLHEISGLEWALAAGVALLLALTLVVAIVAPPNTPDALAYHLPRQLMWLQQHSLAHFETLDDRALMMPPLAEIVQAHTLLLSGGDHWTNLVQWLAYALSAAVASLLAREFGGNSRTQWLAAFACVTLPMAYHQATSAKNDLLVAVWLAILAWQMMRLRAASADRRSDWLAAGAALGLAVATKTTALIFLPPAALLGWPAARREPRAVLLAASVALLLIAPHAWRNEAWYGNPLGVHRAEDGGAEANELHTPQAALSNLVRNATLHLATPWPAFNARVTNAVERLHQRLGLDANDRRTTFWYLPYELSWGPTFETVAGAPAQFLLGGIALVLWGVRGPRRGPLAAGAWWVLGGAVLYAVILKWQPWGARLHLPFFIVLAAVTTCVFERLGRPGVLAVAGLCLLGWLPSAETNQRPVRTRPTVFASSRWENYFRFEPIDGHLQAGVVRTLITAGVRSLQVRSRHAYVYPLLQRFLAEAGPHAALHGAIRGPTSAPADAVLMTEPFGRSLPLYYTGPGAKGRYRAVGATDPYGIYLPEKKARALEATLGLPGFVGWDRDEALSLVGFMPLTDRLAPLRQLVAPACALHFQRTAAQMRVRLEARNVDRAPCRIEVRLNGTKAALVIFDPGGVPLSIEVPIAPATASNTLSLVALDYENASAGSPLPRLLFSRIQILD